MVKRLIINNKIHNMKAKILFAAAAIAAMSACQEQETTIKVDVDGLEDGSVVNLYRMEGKSGDLAQADIVKGGKVSYIFRCDSLSPNTHYDIVIFKGDNNTTNKNIYVKEHTQSTVSGSGNNPKSWKVESKHPKQDYENTMDELAKEEYIEITRLVNCMDTAKTQESRRKLNALINQEYSKITDKTFAAMETMPVTDDYIEEIGNRVGGLINRPNPALQAKFEKLFNRLSDEQKASPIGRKIDLALHGETPTVGDKIIDYDLYDLNGNVHHLSDYKGKWLLIDFCTYFCGVCQMSAPLMNYLYSKNGGTDFEFITISQDEAKDFETMIREGEIKNPAFYDKDGDKGIFALYRIAGWPTFYCVSPDGIIQDHFFGLLPDLIQNFLANSKNFNKPDVKRDGGVVTVSNPISEHNNNWMMLESYELHKDSTVLNFVYVTPGSFSIGGGSVLKYNDGKKSCKAISSSIGFDKFVNNPFKETARVRVSFEPLPKDVKEFDYIEGDCEQCFRIKGIKVE